MARNKTGRGLSYLMMVLGAALGALGSGCMMAPKPFGVTETTTLRVDADGLSRFELSGRVGDIEVTGDPEATEVVAEVTKIGKGTTIAQAQEALEEIEVTLASVNGVEKTVRAEVRHPLTSYTRAWEVKWKVTAPAGIALKLRSKVGDIEVENFGNGVEARSDVGDVRIEEVKGDVVAKSSVGDVRVVGATGQTRATTDVGAIHVTGSGGFYLRSSTGGITLTVTGSADGGIDAATSVGDLRVRVPGSLKGRLTAGTSVGSVNCNLRDIPITNFRSSRRRFSGDLHDASEPAIRLSTSVGDLSVVVK